MSSVKRSLSKKSGSIRCRDCNGKEPETWITGLFYGETRTDSPGCMAMQSGKIYQVHSGRFIGWFVAGFTCLPPRTQ